MLTLQQWFMDNGWDPAYIAYAFGGFSALVLLCIWFYVNSDDFI